MTIVPDRHLNAAADAGHLYIDTSRARMTFDVAERLLRDAIERRAGFGPRRPSQGGRSELGGNSRALGEVVPEGLQRRRQAAIVADPRSQKIGRESCRERSCPCG